jgi:hypothetical protein
MEKTFMSTLHVTDQVDSKSLRRELTPTHLTVTAVVRSFNLQHANAPLCQAPPQH